MSAHDKSARDTRHLCDLLLSETLLHLASVTRNEGDNWCSIGVATRFAFVRHSRNGLRVFLRGQEADGPQLMFLANSSPATVAKRQAMGKEWERVTPYYIDLNSEEGVRAALPLLLYAARQVEGRNGRGSCYLLPSEDSAREMVEGARIAVQVSRIERDPAARKKCLKLFGHSCVVCGFDFEHTFGAIGSGFIHVHHLKPLAEAKGRRRVDPATDLRPVCPNCHEMLHQRNPPFGIEELRAKLSTQF